MLSINTLIIGLAIVVAATLGLPGEAFAGYCTSLSDCVSGDTTGATMVLVGSGTVGGLVGVVAMDGGFCGDAWDVDMDMDEPPEEAPPDEPEPEAELEDYPDSDFGRMA